MDSGSGIVKRIDICDPSHVWLTADWHLSHGGSAAGMAPIRRMGRPYGGCDEARERLIATAQDAISTEDDMLIILGDLVALDVTDGTLPEVLDDLPVGRTHLVLGNHDEGVSEGAWRNLLGEGNVHDGLELILPDIENETHDGHPLCFVCFHYPLKTWKGERFGNAHLHGHLHAFQSYNDWQRAQHRRRYDVGIDANGYGLVRLSDLLSYMGILDS